MPSKEEGFWIKVWCKVKGRQEQTAIEKEKEEGDVSRIVFRPCIVDVLIDSVRFSFSRLHGVFHADSGE